MKSFRILLFLVVLCAACGKAGLPDPGDPSKNFSWKTYTAKNIGNCLAFSGQIDGAHRNVDSVRLELSPVNGPEDCPGCPFVAGETITFTPKEAGMDKTSGTFSFSYCPTPAAAFRWRLVGVNVYSSLPYVVTPAQFTSMSQ